MIERRNRQQRMLSVASVFVVAGLASYLGAVVVAALASAENFAG